MATLQLQPPEPFDFKTPDGWPKWKRRFMQYRDAAGLSSESETQQVNTLLYCLGEEAKDVLASTDISDEDIKKFNPVMQKFDEFFKVRHNVIFERARFNQRTQLPGEGLVVGILDKKTSQQLQLDPRLTVEKAKTTIRQKEAVREQGQELDNNSSEPSWYSIIIERRVQVRFEFFFVFFFH